MLLDLLLISVFAGAEPDSLARSYVSGPFRVHFEFDYLVERQHHAGHKEAKVHTTYAKRGSVLLTLTTFDLPSKEAALAMQKSKLAQIDTVFEEHPTGYFSMVSRSTVCAQAFLPRKEEIPRKQSTLKIWTMFATARNSFGACAEDIAQKRAAVALLTCGSQLIQLEKFVPRSEWVGADFTELRSIDCGG